MRTLLIVLTLALATLCACQRAEPPKRPNIIIVCIDALRRDHLGVYGHDGGISPNIDALARDSVVFDQAVSVASWTKPSVTSILTGLYPGQHGVLHKWTRTSKRRVDVLAPEVDTLAELLKRANYHTGAFVENDHLLKRYSHLDQGFDTYVEDAGAAPVLVQRFLSWLHESPPGEPVFAYLHILDPHWPYTPDSTTSLPIEDQLRAKHWGFGGTRWRLLRDGVNDGQLALDAPELATLKTLYAAKISATDTVLGSMFQLLRDTGALERTFLVVTADHGEGFLEHGKLDHGYGLFDELLRVPLIVHLPQAEFGGRRIQTQVQTVDLAPTILDYLHLPPHRPAGGRSFLPILRGAGTAPDQAALSQEGYGHMLVTSVRTKSYKYIRITRGGQGPLPVRLHVPTDLQPGVRVQAEGIFVGGRIVAGSVKRITSADLDQKIVGPVAAVDAATNKLRVIGYRVQADSKTHFRDGTSPITFADLHPQQWVRAQGLVQRGNLRAARIQRISEPSGQRIQLEGVIEGLGVAGTAGLWLELCGARVLVINDASWKDFGADRTVVGSTAAEEQPVVPRTSEELYDLVADPGELRNIATDQPQRLAEFRNRLDELQSHLAPALKKAPSSVELDKATLDRLRSLGYLN